jgi:phage shock protein PspC (stress-responsive transcriptional regulator)
MNPEPARPARLTRSKHDRMIGGVAGGIAAYLNVDTAWIRIAWLALLILGPGFILYIVAWIVMPESTEADPLPVRAARAGDNGRLIVGGLLVVIGGSLLANRYLPWMEDLILPAILIALGVGVIVYSLRK